MRGVSILLFVLLLSFSQNSFSQIEESFSDGNFTSNPVWFGDVTKFSVVTPSQSGAGSISAQWNADANLLQSKPDSSDAVLVTSSSQAYGQWSWSFADGKDWAISGSNDCYTILMCDTSNTSLLKDNSMNFNGYFLRFDGGSGDSFVLYKQAGTVSTAIIASDFPTGSDGTTSKAYSIKVIRETNGLWKLFINDGLYQDATTLRGSIVDNDIINSKYFGVATNVANPSVARVAYFDDIYIGDIFVDTIPPVINTYEFIGDKSIKLTFDENISATSINTANFVVDNSISPQVASFINQDSSVIVLQFNITFSGGSSLSLHINNVEDNFNNVLDSTFTIAVPAVIGQNIEDSFSDNEFLYNPEWSGCINSFEVINPPTSGYGSIDSAYFPDGHILSSKVNTSDAVLTTKTLRNYGEWHFSVADGSGWSISSNNDFYVILTADTNDTTLLKSSSMNFNGYYLRFDGSTNDDFVLYRQNGTVATAILDSKIPGGSDGTTSKPYSIRITRNNIGVWKLFIQEGLYKLPYTLIDSVDDNSITTGQYFGFVTHIGSPSQYRVAYLDDVYVGEIIEDTVSPKLESYDIINSKNISLQFSESIDSSNIELSNFVLTNSSISPISIEYNNSNSQFKLLFENSFEIDQQLALKITSLSDLSGNILTDTTINFTYHIVSEGDVVINEVFFDNTPVVGLPEYDYIELYNRSEQTIDLNKWILKIGDNESGFSSVKLPANQYLIITSSSGIAEYQQYGRTLGLISTTELTNSGKEVILSDSLGNIIHSINYSADWYHNTNKEDGGWSIEQIDPDAYCSKINNWTASVDVLGGTPGKINSVDGYNIDTTAPKVIFASIMNSTKIQFAMSEECSKTQFNSSHISFNPEIGPLTYVQDENDKKIWTIELSEELPQNTKVEFKLTNIIDNCGNVLSDTTIPLYLIPYQFQQVVFNEVLFNANSDYGIDYEYVELYNRDSLPLSVANWTFYAGSSSYKLPTVTIGAHQYLLIAPKRLTDSIGMPSNTIYLLNDAALSNSGTMLKLENADNQLVSWVEYSSSLHDIEIAKQGGYSLERIDVNNLGFSTENWATCTATYHGTPGTENSVKDVVEDDIKPEILYLATPNDTTLHVYFTENLWPDSTTVNIIINNSTIKKAGIIHPYGNVLEVNMLSPLKSDFDYLITIRNYSDCNKNIMEQESIDFKLPVAPSSNDLVISEILYNPNTDGSDFVEVCNIGSSYLALDQMFLCNVSDIDEPTNLLKPVSDRFIIAPNNYVIFTQSYTSQQEFYSPVNHCLTFETNTPSMSSTDGSIGIVDTAGNLIDYVKYTDNMQNSLLANTKGVSLERVSLYTPSSIVSNWQSAASLVGYATPTRENSHNQQQSVSNDKISIENKTLSPDGDGFEDILPINYQFANGSVVLTIRILDSKGRVVKDLTNNETVETSGFVAWDGTDNDLNKVSVGLYIINAEWLDESGNQGNKQIVCVVGGNLK